MPLWLRRTLIGIAVLAALLAAGAAWLVARFDADRFKDVAIEWVREHRGRTLAIDGPIGLSVFPRLQLTLRDLRLSEARRDAEFLSLQEASFAVQLLPLLRKEVVIDRVAANGVRLAYRRDAKGVRNIDDLLAGDDATAGAQAPPTKASEPDRALRFEVSGIDLRDLQATIDDAVLGISGTVALADFRSGRLADGVESPLELKGRLAWSRPAVAADVELSGRVTLSLAPARALQVSLSGISASLRGDLPGAKGLDTRLTGALFYDGATGALRADRAKLALAGRAGAWELADSSVELVAVAFEPAARRLKLDGLDARIAARNGTTAATATLAWPTLEASGDTLRGSALKGTARIDGPDGAALTLRFESQAPTGRFERIRVPGLQLALEGLLGRERSLRADARADLSLDTSPLAASLDALSAQLAFADPAFAPLKLDVRGQARASAAAARIALDGSLNTQPFTATGTADLAGKRARVNAQASFAALDLTRFLKPGTAGAADRSPGGTAGRADTPVDLSPLKALDGRFALRAGTVVYPPYRVADAALDATVDAGVLRVSQLSGKAWGGRFDARGTAHAEDQRVAFKLDATQVDIAALLRDVAQFERLEGRGRVSADLQTRGATVQQLKQRLGGSAAIELRDGAVRGINLAKTLRQWKSAVALDRDAVQAARTEEKTDFSEINASFVIADGVARNRDLDAKSPFLRVNGEGTIDIGKGRIDYLARATVTDTAEGQGGAELAALRGVSVPVRIEGPLEQVDYRLQWSAVAASLLTKRAKEALSGAAGNPTRAAVGKLLEGVGVARPAAGASAPKGAASAPTPTPKDLLRGLFGK